MSSESLRQVLEMTPFFCILLNQINKLTVGSGHGQEHLKLDELWQRLSLQAFLNLSTMNCCGHYCVSVNVCSRVSWRDGSMEGKDGLDRVAEKMY